MEPLRLELASGNPHKAVELAAALPPGWQVGLLGAGELPEETGASYYENARAKARFGRERGDPGAWAVGEDSGIEVEALGGGPGIRSARYAGPGEDPIEKLLSELRAVEDEGRRARYVCELVCLSPALEERRGTGVLEGSIAAGPRGSEGFGYDPVFVPEGETRTVAELGDRWKARSSHRARAAAALVAALGVRAADQ